MDLPFDSHDLSAAESIDAAKAGDFDAETLLALRAHEETRSRPRSSYLAVLDELIADAPEAETDPEPEEVPAAEPEPEVPEPEVPVATEPDVPWDLGDRVLVTRDAQKHEGVIVGIGVGLAVRLRDGSDTVVFVPEADAELVEG